MPAAKHFFKKFPGDIWIETGTYQGDGISQAVEAGYERIISIELSERLAADAKQRFEDNHRISIINGKAHEVLPDVLRSLHDKKIVFWLDAHYSACGTAGEEDPNPLMKELKAIKEWRSITNAVLPTILIDDMRTFTYDNCGFSEKEIVQSITEIDSKYLFRREDGPSESFLNDILVATIA